MIDAGRLKTRLVIAAPVERDDGQGGVLRSHEAVATVWAAVRPLRARRAPEADADGAWQQVRVLLRSGHALTLQHRLIDGARSYRIAALREIDDGLIEVDAEWRVA